VNALGTKGFKDHQNAWKMDLLTKILKMFLTVTCTLGHSSEVILLFGRKKNLCY